MYNSGFYALFLILSFGLGSIVLVFGLVTRNLFDHKPKPKPLTLKAFRKLIPNAKTKEDALGLIEKFSTTFGIIAPESEDKQEWLDIVRELVSLEAIDTDKAAEVREQLITKNPNLQKDIADSVGIALKTKKDVK